MSVAIPTTDEPFEEECPEGVLTVASLVAALSRLPPFDNPLTAAFRQIGTTTITFGDVLVYRDLLTEAAIGSQEETDSRQKVAYGCMKIRPIPLSAVPLGY
jgi:hypothetical protein